MNHHITTFQRDTFGQLSVATLAAELPGWQARLASILIERWGLVACELDGEDSQGRQKMRRLTPKELVTQACETAELAIAEFHARGWVDKALTQEQIDAVIEDARARAKAKADASKPRVEIEGE